MREYILVLEHQLTLSLSLPGEQDDPIDIPLGAQVDAPGGHLDEGVVDGGAGSQVSRRVAVDGQRRVTAHFAAAMTLPRLPVVVRLRLAFVRQISH